MPAGLGDLPERGLPGDAGGGNDLLSDDDECESEFGEHDLVGVAGYESL